MASARSAPVVEASPFVGLRSYTAQESAVYVGRERAYQALVEACLRDDAPRAVVVLGDSGAGKSSLLAAGLIGTACAPDGPLAAFTPVAVRVADLHTLTLPPGRVLLVVDQVEEAAALPAAERAAFFDALTGLPPRVTSVVAITADAFGFAMRDERLAASLAAPILVGPLSTAEYTRIIEEPARRHGRTVAPDLVRLILRDLRLYGEPAPGTALPLLSSAMRRCWAAAHGATLTPTHYLAMGGLWSALDEEAEAVHAGLTEQQKPLARRLLLALIQLDGDRVLRGRLPLEDLSEEMSPIVDAFLGSRLFTLYGGSVAVSHDALLTRWQRLRGWIDEERASLLIARRIQMAAQVWEEGGSQDDALMPVEAELWSTWARQESAPLLSARENSFITSSLDLADAQQRAQADTIRTLRRRQQLAVAAAAIAIAMLVVAVGAGLQSSSLRQAGTGLRAIRAGAAARAHRRRDPALRPQSRGAAERGLPGARRERGESLGGAQVRGHPTVDAVRRAERDHHGVPRRRGGCDASRRQLRERDALARRLDHGRGRDVRQRRRPAVRPRGRDRGRGAPWSWSGASRPLQCGTSPVNPPGSWSWATTPSRTALRGPVQRSPSAPSRVTCAVWTSRTRTPRCGCPISASTSRWR